MDLKIGMVAPTRSGKTSLMTAIFHEMKSRLVGNTQGIQYYADSNATKIAIQRAMAEFVACTATDDIFAVPRMAGNQECSNYKFAFTIPVPAGTQRLNIDIMDYPGGWLGTPSFNKVLPHLIDSPALLVPIPADILMDWKKNIGVNNQRAVRIAAAAHFMLEVDNVLDVIRQWSRKRIDLPSLLIFVPIRCEACFNDNGGANDLSETLHEAVQSLYVNALNLNADEEKMIQIETHAVDTYGIVELQDIRLTRSPEGDYLESNFRKRLNCENKLMIKGAFEVFSTIVNFQMNQYAKQLGITRREIEEAIQNRGFFNKVWALITGDPEKKKLLETIRRNDGTIAAMNTVSSLFHEFPNRQRILNKLED